MLLEFCALWKFQRNIVKLTLLADAISLEPAAQFGIPVVLAKSGPGGDFLVPPAGTANVVGLQASGKTTLFNVINGVYAPQKGQIVFRGEDISGLPPFKIARRGIARTHQIVRPLGSGGMGMVWLATETRLGRSVAIKVLPPELTRDQARVMRFEQEALVHIDALYRTALRLANRLRKGSP